MSHDLTNTKQIREHNMLILRRALHKAQVATIAQLHELTGLSIVTINKLIDILIQSGEIIKNSDTYISGGRPAAAYQFNGNYKFLLIITCYQRKGNYYATYSVHNLFGDSIERHEELLSTVHTDEFIEGIERYLERYNKIAIIGISMPSDTIGGRVASALRKDPQSKRLSHHLELKFNVPVFFETDVNAATLGCYKRLSSNNEYISGLVLVYGRAPALGFCHHGTLLKGKDGMAGEVRFFPMYNDVGLLPTDPMQAEELAIRTLKAVMCVLNPSYVVVYTEDLKHNLGEKLIKRIQSEAELVLVPTIEVNNKIKDDTVSGMVSLALDRLAEL